MKKLFTCIFIILLLPLFLKSQGERDIDYTIIDVYTSPDIDEGDTIDVIGYYTDPDVDLLIDFYGDYVTDEIFAPQSVLTMTGAVPPVTAHDGGFIQVYGVVTYDAVADPYHPEDTVMASLEALTITEIMPAPTIPGPPPRIEQQEIKKSENDNDDSGSRNGCDPCKFAILISGGGNAANNHSKYWENLVALYKFKVDSLGYCDSNVFVHYYHGTRRDNRIPSANVTSADSAKIDSTHQLVANRVAQCTKNGMQATFQKMVTNHGAPDGINLLGSKKLKPDHLRDIQQPIIDSCCTTVFDEFLQCYGGNTVDEISNMNDRNKATIYINSNANNTTGVSPHGQAHPYLLGKINTLDTGGSYERAVVNGKLAYDSYLQGLVNRATTQAQLWRNSPPETPDRVRQAGLWAADSARLAAKICKSRNVTIVPFTYWCQWQEFVVPPGGQLKVDFEGKSNSCGNVTIYKVDPETGEIVKVKVWNWNHPGSYRYYEGNNQRAVNGDVTGSTTFWIHNDNDTSRLRVEALGTPVMDESPSNGFLFPGFSFGGSDNSPEEFYPLPIPIYFVDMIDQPNLSLDSLPAILGQGFVQQFGFSFQINPSDPFWSEMELVLKVNNVNDPSDLIISSPSGSIPEVTVPIFEPDTYVIPLGDFTQYGDPFGIITMIPTELLQMELDSWGLRSVYGYPSPPTTTWLGLISDSWTDPSNWSDGVPGPYHHVIVNLGDGFQPRIDLDVSIWTITIMDGATVNTAPGAILMVNGQ